MALSQLNDKNVTSTDDIMEAIHVWLTTTITNTWNSVDGLDLVGNTLDLDTGTCFVQFSWDTATIDFSQSVSSLTPVALGAEAGDVGRDSRAEFPAAVTQAELWGFTNDTATAGDQYAHFVVEFNKDGRFIHFGFGHVPAADKYFPWSGGAYKYGGEWEELSQGDEPWSLSHRIGLDGMPTNTTINVATMLATGIRDQPASSKAGMFSEASVATVNAFVDADTDPLTCWFGFTRYGPWVSMALFQRVSPNNSAIHLIPIVIGQRVSNAAYMPMGEQPDTKICNIGNIQPKDSITFDSETYQFFPWAQKLTLLSDQNIEASRNGGIAYRTA